MRHQGFSLLETVVALGMVIVLVLIFTASLNALTTGTALRASTQAYQLAQTMLDSVRALPFSEIPTQTAGKPIFLPVERGSWTVADVGGSRALTTDGLATPRITVPRALFRDGTVETQVRLGAGTPAGAGVLLLLRYWNDDTHCVVRLAQNDLTVRKFVDGVSTTLYDSPPGTPTVGLDAWHTLAVTVDGSSMQVDVNGSTLTTVVDTALSRGLLVLGAENDARVSFDDVRIDTIPVLDGTFESSALGKSPDSWRTSTLASLPEGTAALTIAPYDGLSDLYQITATVTWSRPSGSRSAVLDTLISRNGIDQ
ncbi:MAG: hypothetical protein HY341_00390 [Candidatus Kerfeldbacteria bacterium]|nr:hypothetical protein [Candidatus Kerfeldbacteria bacterium]